MRFTEWLTEGDWDSHAPNETREHVTKQLEGLAEQATQLLKRLQKICLPFTNSYSMIGTEFRSADNDPHLLVIPFHYVKYAIHLEPWKIIINCLAAFPTEDLRQIHRIASKLKDIYKEQKQAKFKLMSDFGPRGQT